MIFCRVLIHNSIVELLKTGLFLKLVVLNTCVFRHPHMQIDAVVWLYLVGR